MNIAMLTNRLIDEMKIFLEQGDEEDAPAEDVSAEDSGDEDASPKDDLKEPEEKQKEVVLSPLEELQHNVNDHLAEFKEHFAQYFKVKKPKQIYKKNVGLVVFPTKEGPRFELFFLIRQNKDDKTIVIKMATYVFYKSNRKKMDKREFDKEDLVNNISMPEALFPTRKVENVLGMDLEPKEECNARR